MDEEESEKTVPRRIAYKTFLASGVLQDHSGGEKKGQVLSIHAICAIHVRFPVKIRRPEASFRATSAILAKNTGSMRENTCTSSKDVVL